MFEEKGDTLIITCDKCGRTHSVSGPSRELSSRHLYDAGWRANFRAKKYVHWCRACGQKRRKRR